MDRPNLVYSTHVYPNRGDDWHGAFGDLASRAPVFAGEWGGQDADLTWGRKLVDYFDRLNLGWTAWSWHNDPLLVKKYTPTPFGKIVHDNLARRVISRTSFPI